MYDEFKAEGFEVLGFPSNDFRQELDCNESVRRFSIRNGAEWKVMSKTHVKWDPSLSKDSDANKNVEPLFAFLQNYHFDSLGSDQKGRYITWNFHKYVIGRDGKPVKVLGRRDDVRSVIEEELKKPNPFAATAGKKVASTTTSNREKTEETESTSTVETSEALGRMSLGVH